MIKSFQEVKRNPVVITIDEPGLEQVMVYEYWEDRSARTIDDEFSMMVLYKYINHKLRYHTIKLPRKALDNDQFLLALVKSYKDFA